MSVWDDEDDAPREPARAGADGSENAVLEAVKLVATPGGWEAAVLAPNVVEDGDFAAEVVVCGANGAEPPLAVAAVGRDCCCCKELLPNMELRELLAVGGDSVVDFSELVNWKPELGVVLVAPGKSGRPEPPSPAAELVGGSDFGGSERGLPPLARGAGSEP